MPYSLPKQPKAILMLPHTIKNFGVFVLVTSKKKKSRNMTITINLRYSLIRDLNMDV